MHPTNPPPESLRPKFSLNLSRMISRDEVDAEFGIPKRFLEIAACKGGGPAFVKIGRLTRYKVEDLLTWIDEHRFENTSQVQQAATPPSTRTGRSRIEKTNRG